MFETVKDGYEEIETAITAAVNRARRIKTIIDSQAVPVVPALSTIFSMARFGLALDWVVPAWVL